MNSGPFDSVAAVGDVSNVSTWSGTPYHLWQAALGQGWQVEPWRLELGPFHWSRRWWNLGAVLRGRRTGPCRLGRRRFGCGLCGR